MDQMAKNRINKISKEAIDRIDKAAQEVKQDLHETIIHTEDYEEMEIKAAECRLLETIRKKLIGQRDQELHRND